MACRAGNRAPHQPIYPEGGSQEKRPGNQPQIINNWGQGRQQKVLMDIQNPAGQATDAENDGRKQGQPHQVGGEKLRFLGKTGGDEPLDQGQGDNGNQHRCCYYQQQDGVEGSAGQPPAGRIFGGMAGQPLAEDGDKGRGQRAAGDEHKQNIGQAEGRDKSIVIAASAKGTGNSDLPPDGQTFIDQKGGHQNCRRADKVACFDFSQFDLGVALSI
jgi:hypothetical protein